MELNAEQIKKALECCIEAETWGDCQESGCPALTKHGCGFSLRTDNDNENAIYIEMFKDALALINSQEQRIKELTVDLEAMRGAANSYKMHNKELTEENARLKDTRYIAYPDGRIEMLPTIESVRADTVRKMQEKLKRYYDRNDTYLGYSIAFNIDRVANEMLEGTDD